MYKTFDPLYPSIETDDPGEAAELLKTFPGLVFHNGSCLNRVAVMKNNTPAVNSQYSTRGYCYWYQRKDYLPIETIKQRSNNTVLFCQYRRPVKEVEKDFLIQKPVWSSNAKYVTKGLNVKQVAAMLEGAPRVAAFMPFCTNLSTLMHCGLAELGYQPKAVNLQSLPLVLVRG